MPYEKVERARVYWSRREMPGDAEEDELQEALKKMGIDLGVQFRQSDDGVELILTKHEA